MMRKQLVCGRGVFGIPLRSDVGLGHPTARAGAAKRPVREGDAATSYRVSCSPAEPGAGTEASVQRGTLPAVVGSDTAVGPGVGTSGPGRYGHQISRPRFGCMGSLPSEDACATRILAQTDPRWCVSRRLERPRGASRVVKEGESATVDVLP